jgi:ketosteroid isomerase-like protein
MATQSAEDRSVKNVAIARAAYEAYVRKNRAALEALLASDFHFTSPLDNRLDRETYFRRCWPNSKTIEGFDFVHLVTDADRVFVTYEGRNTDGHRFRNTEILTIESSRSSMSRCTSAGHCLTRRRREDSSKPTLSSRTHDSGVASRAPRRPAGKARRLSMRGCI